MVHHTDRLTAQSGTQQLACDSGVVRLCPVLLDRRKTNIAVYTAVIIVLHQCDNWSAEITGTFVINSIYATTHKIIFSYY